MKAVGTYGSFVRGLCGTRVAANDIIQFTLPNCLIISWPVCQEQVLRSWTSNHIPLYLWDVITCLCPCYLLCFWHTNLLLSFAQSTACSDIAVTSYERHGVSNNWQLACLFNTLFGIKARKISKHHITDPLREESSSEQWFPSHRTSNAESDTM